MFNQRGSVLLMSLSVVSALAVMGAGFALLMVNERLALMHSIASVQTLYLAEAGIEKAVYDLRQDYIHSGHWNDGDINGTAVVPVANQFYPLYMSISLGAGSYTVWMKNDGVDPDKVWLRSTGAVGQAQSTLLVYVMVSNPLGPVLKETGWQIVS